MEENSLSYSEKLYSQIEDAFGKILYSYTTQVVEAGRVEKKNCCLKWGQFILSAISTGGFLSTLITNSQIALWVGGLCSTALLALTAYFQNFDLSSLYKNHLETSNKLWVIREKYVSLLTDFSALSLDEIIKRRDELLHESRLVYETAPITSKRSYSIAENMIKNKEAQYFSREELNKMLPSHLRKKN